MDSPNGMDLKASVVLLTKNPGSSFRETLEAIYRQNLKPMEVLVIDSGSTDGTISLVQKYPAQLIQIKPEAFGHGRTRNLGGNLAKGEFLVFLTQDAVPVREDWLFSLVHPLGETEALAGVYGRQIPRHSDPFETFSRYYTYPPVSHCHRGKDLLHFSVFHLLFSNVNAALRREVWKKFPFDETLIMSEDQEWARRVLQRGFEILYEPRAMVHHSHREGPLRLFKRGFDSGVSFQQMSAADGMFHHFPETWAYLKEEIHFLIQTGNSFWIPLLFPRELLRAGGFMVGRYGEKIPKPLKRWCSFHTQYWRK